VSRALAQSVAGPQDRTLLQCRDVRCASQAALQSCHPSAAGESPEYQE
jgi:hypothetical protein